MSSHVRSAAWRSRQFPGNEDHIVTSLMGQCAYKIDKPYSGTSGGAKVCSELDDADAWPLLESAKHRAERNDNYHIPKGQTIKGMVNQDDDEDFLAMNKAIEIFDASDSEGFAPNLENDENRKKPLLCHSPSSSRPRGTGKGSRRATSRRPKLPIKVAPAAMKHLSSY